jgi:hypothetical protein
MLRVFGFRLLEDWDTDASILRERDEIFESSECSKDMSVSLIKHLGIKSTPGNISKTDKFRRHSNQISDDKS